MRNFIDRKSLMELVRYGFAGVTTTMVNLLLYHLFLFCGMDYRLGNLLALVGSKTYGYLVNKIFVFRSHCKNTKELLVEILSFIGARGLTGLIDYFGLIFMVEIIGVGKIVSKYIIQVLVIILNYVMGKFFVFKDGKSGEDKTSKSKY